MELLQHIRDNGQIISPLMLAPWVKIDIFRPDWLHCADQGVTADYIGNLFLLISEKLQGANKDLRVAALWRRTCSSILVRLIL